MAGIAVAGIAGAKDDVLRPCHLSETRAEEAMSGGENQLPADEDPRAMPHDLAEDDIQPADCAPRAIGFEWLPGFLQSAGWRAPGLLLSGGTAGRERRACSGSQHQTDPA